MEGNEQVINESVCDDNGANTAFVDDPHRPCGDVGVAQPANGVETKDYSRKEDGKEDGRERKSHKKHDRKVCCRYNNGRGVLIRYRNPVSARTPAIEIEIRSAVNEDIAVEIRVKIQVERGDGRGNLKRSEIFPAEIPPEVRRPRTKLARQVGTKGADKNMIETNLVNAVGVGIKIVMAAAAVGVGRDAGAIAAETGRALLGIDTIQVGAERDGVAVRGRGRGIKRGRKTLGRLRQIVETSRMTARQ